MLLTILEAAIAVSGLRSTATDRTFAGCRDGLHAIALAWNRVLRPIVIPRVQVTPIPMAFGGEGATMNVLGVPVTCYFEGRSLSPRLRAGGEDVSLPPSLSSAVILVASAVGRGSPIAASCGAC